MKPKNDAASRSSMNTELPQLVQNERFGSHRRRHEPQIMDRHPTPFSGLALTVSVARSTRPHTSAACSSICANGTIAIYLWGEVAQLVEHVTENHGVDSSILSLATISQVTIS